MNNDRYQIGTPEMIRKDKLREAKSHEAQRLWREVRRSEGFAAFMAILLSISFALFIVFFVKGSAANEARKLAEKEALDQAHAELEASCIAESGSFLEVKSGYLCLADNIIIFNVEDVMSDEARQITGIPATNDE